MKLDELLGDLDDWLDECTGAEGVGTAEGQLAEPNKSFVASRLTSGENHIATLRDPDLDPTLDPFDIGEVIASYDPVTTRQFAHDCRQLAHQAFVESTRPTPSHQYIGDCIATISNLLHGYRVVAGID